MKTLVENYGSLDASHDLLLERLDVQQIEAAAKLIEILEKIIGPVADKLPLTTKAIKDAKKIINQETTSGLVSKIRDVITPNLFKPLTRLNSAIGFISALAQGLVQASRVFTSFSNVPADKADIPLSQVVDKMLLFKQLRSAITPDGVLGFLRGMPMADDTAIARELMELTSNDFKAITSAVTELKKKPAVAKAVVRGAKAMAGMKKKAKQNKKTGEDDVTPEKTPETAKTTGDGASPTPETPKAKGAAPKMRPFSKKKYADALHTAVKKSANVTPEQISAFIDNIAGILSKQGIAIQESVTLRGRVGSALIKENIDFSDIQAAAEKAGITGEDDHAVLAYKLAKMIVSDRVDNKSGALPRVFPADFKITKIPAAKAIKILDVGSEKADKSFWEKDAVERKDATKRMKNPKNMSLEFPIVENPYGLKGAYIPLQTNDPQMDGILVQGRDISQEDKGDDYEYEDKSGIWYINVKKLLAMAKKYGDSMMSNDQPESTEGASPDDAKTVIQQREPSKKTTPAGA